jgi:glycosyltransferase involved in cell wall biosynthesis
MAEMRLAYLVSQYPATSHTFISREVAALRALGADPDTFSIRATPSADLADGMWADEAASTYTVLRQPLTTFIGAQLAYVFSQPGRYFRTLGLALRHRVPGLRGFAMSFVYFAEAAVLARELNRRNVARLHNHFANPGAIAGLLASKLAGIPWSFTMHGISETDYPAGLLLGEKIRDAEFVACVSYFGRAQAMRLVSTDQWQKLHIVRCGLPLTTLPKRREVREGKRLICVGRLSPEKGQAGLLQAVAAVARDIPDLKLVIVGDGPDRGALDALVRDLNLPDQVTFAGRLSEQDTLREIAASDILVLPSFMEGLPIVLMEAMAVGVPVIASRVAGIPELVTDGESGLLFTPSDWSELAKCIETLSTSVESRARIGRAGQETVERDFDIAQSATNLRKLFQLGEAA